MADNRQFTDHNEIGGVNVYLEDKKLAESPEQNTVATTDYVLLKDTDGVPHKISKANMMSVVKDALADLLKSNDLGTSVTNVPALNASAFGSATVANLASVLGVERYEIAVGGSCEIKGDCMIVMDYNQGSGSGIILNGYGAHVNVVEFAYASYSHEGNNITITNISQSTVDVIAIKIR